MALALASSALSVAGTPLSGTGEVIFGTCSGEAVDLIVCEPKSIDLVELIEVNQSAKLVQPSIPPPPPRPCSAQLATYQTVALIGLVSNPPGSPAIFLRIPTSQAWMAASMRASLWCRWSEIGSLALDEVGDGRSEVACLSEVDITAGFASQC